MSVKNAGETPTTEVKFRFGYPEWQAEVYHLASECDRPGILAAAAKLRIEEIQTTRTLNKRHGAIPENSVYVGRPSKWGNPFEIGTHGTRAEVIARHRAWICDQPALLDALSELRGRHLVCWCAPAACHADTLREMANAR